MTVGEARRHFALNLYWASITTRRSTPSGSSLGAGSVGRGTCPNWARTPAGAELLNAAVGVASSGKWGWGRPRQSGKAPG